MARQQRSASAPAPPPVEDAFEDESQVPDAQHEAHDDEAPPDDGSVDTDSLPF